MPRELAEEAKQLAPMTPRALIARPHSDSPNKKNGEAGEVPWNKALAAV